MSRKNPFHLRNVLVRDISLLVSLVILLLISPFLYDTLPHRIFASMLTCLSLGSGMVVIAKHKVVFWIAGVLLGVSIIAEIYLLYFPSPFLLEFHYIHKMVNFFFFACVLFYYMMKKKTFTYQDIANAINVNLLIGISFGFLYCYIETVSPGSFTYAAPQKESLPATLIYFSYVTLATIGYGDISPAAIIARFLAIFEAMFGLFYIAIIIGRMVGMSSAEAEK
jgi:hypothetical protein